MSISPVRANALEISCCADHNLVNEGSSSWHISHSTTSVPAVPPDTGSAFSQLGGAGISSVGVTVPGQAIASPILPSGYSIAIDPRYTRPSDRGSVVPSLSASVIITDVCAQKEMLVYVEKSSNSSSLGFQFSLPVASHTKIL